MKTIGNKIKNIVIYKSINSLIGISKPSAITLTVHIVGLTSPRSILPICDKLRSTLQASVQIACGQKITPIMWSFFGSVSATTVEMMVFERYRIFQQRDRFPVNPIAARRMISVKD